MDVMWFSDIAPDLAGRAMAASRLRRQPRYIASTSLAPLFCARQWALATAR